MHDDGKVPHHDHTVEGLAHRDHGWLDTRYHFSFSDYMDPERMGWGRIRVWNDDRIAPQTGFPPHSHSDMEIITFVRTGAISHRDSMGNEGRTGAGDVQVMCAGTGVSRNQYTAWGGGCPSAAHSAGTTGALAMH